MKAPVLMEIESLRRATLADLPSKFRELFQQPTPCRHREHLFRRIAWRLQPSAEDDLTDRARTRALAFARDAGLRKVPPRDSFKLTVIASKPHRSHLGMLKFGL